MTVTDTDPQNPLLSLAADFKVTLDSLASTLKQQQRLTARADQSPAYATVQGVCQVPANTGEGVLLFDGGSGPVQGSIWNVRRLITGGQGSVLSAVAGRADVFVSSIDPRTFTDPIVGMGMLQWVDSAAALPNIAFYGKGELRLIYPEKLYMIFTGGNVGDFRAAVAFIEVEQDAAYVNVAT